VTKALKIEISRSAKETCKCTDPRLFLNLQIVFACLEKVGDLNLCFLSFLMPSYLFAKQKNIVKTLGDKIMTEEENQVTYKASDAYRP